MKKYLNIFLFSLIFLLPVYVLAKNEDAPGNQTGQGNVEQPVQAPQGNTNSETGAQYQNQNQVQNAGEEQQLNNAFQQQAEGELSNRKGLSENAGEVAKHVHKLLNSETLSGGIGQQVREFARTQNESQENLMQNIERIQNRNQFTRFLFGTDRNAVAEMQAEMNRNQTRLLQLVNIKDSITNPEDTENVQAFIDSLREQNLELAETIEEESKDKGIFGWFIDLLNNQ
jgi:hypothetical protein